MSSESQTTKGVKDFLWSYSIVMFVLAGFVVMAGITAIFQEAQDNPNPHEDWKVALGGFIVSIVFFVGIGYLPYKAGSFLQNTNNQTFSAVGYPFIEKGLNIYFKIFAVSFVILLFNLFVLFILLICVTIGTIYSIFIILGAILIVLVTVGFILLSDNFTPLEHLKEVWELLMLPSKIFELEGAFLQTIHINPAIIIPFSIILFVITPNVIAAFILMNKEKFLLK
jgi:hypothetical protein